MDNLNISNEVKEFHKDRDQFLSEKDIENPHISKKWMEILNKHYQTLLPLAEAGDAWAQYSISEYYSFSLLRENGVKTEQEFISDTNNMNIWLKKAAEQGHFGALDNLLSSQHGTEPERLRHIFTKNTEFSHSPAPTKGWQEDMRLLHKLAYESS